MSAKMADTGADTPRVAVVVACYNEGRLVEETVSSLLADEPCELVVVNDGSTEATTLATIADLERAGIRVIHQPNRGLSAAVMAGVGETSAPYVLVFSADDLLDKGAIAELADALDANPEAAAAWGDSQTFGITHFRLRGLPAIDPWHLTYVNGLPGIALYRRRELIEIGGLQLPEGLEDWDLWMALAERGYRGIYIPRIVFWYRRDRGGRLLGLVEKFETHYEQLQSRHPKLFSDRPENRTRSAAPPSLKILVPLIDHLPLLSRLKKVQLAELLTRFLWTDGAKATLMMGVQALRVRVRYRYLA